jgi:type II secretory pathway pseudopilin PulG
MTRPRGLTFLELTVIITVLAVIAVITVPKYQLMVHQSREGRTKANLGDLRGALAIYYSDNNGLYPSDYGTPETRLVDSLTPRYLPAVPPTDLPHLYREKKNTIQDRFNDHGDWVYSLVDGFIAVNSAKADTKQRPISGW